MSDLAASAAAVLTPGDGGAGELDPPTTLLYVEDDDDLRDLVAIALVDAGFEVTAVASAEAALDRLVGRSFDVVVTDYNLTGENAAWLLRTATARALLERTAVIVLTSERQPAGVAGHRVLHKPADFGLLLATIEEAVGQTLPAPVVQIGAPPPAELELILYLTSTSQESLKALRNVRRVLRSYDAARYRLTIVDVAHGGDDAWSAGLEEDRVIVTPTLVRRRPLPKQWIMGTLAPGQALEQVVAGALGEADLQD